MKSRRLFHSLTLILSMMMLVAGCSTIPRDPEGTVEGLHDAIAGPEQKNQPRSKQEPSALGGLPGGALDGLGEGTGDTVLAGYLPRGRPRARRIFETENGGGEQREGQDHQKQPKSDSGGHHAADHAPIGLQRFQGDA